MELQRTPAARSDSSILSEMPRTCAWERPLQINTKSAIGERLSMSKSTMSSARVSCAAAMIRSMRSRSCM